MHEFTIRVGPRTDEIDASRYELLLAEGGDSR